MDTSTDGYLIRPNPLDPGDSADRCEAAGAWGVQLERDRPDSGDLPAGPGLDSLR